MRYLKHNSIIMDLRELIKLLTKYEFFPTLIEPQNINGLLKSGNEIFYQYDTNGDPISVIKEYLIEKGDELVRITNISVDSEGKYKYDTRRRFIDIDGTRN